MRVKVCLPETISIEDAEFLAEKYGGDYRGGSVQRGCDTWIFSRVTEGSWRNFEKDIAIARGTIIQILKANPLGEMLVVAGANPRRRGQEAGEDYLQAVSDAANSLAEIVWDRLTNSAQKLGREFSKSTRDVQNDIKKDLLDII